MKVIVSESKLGVEYVADVVSSCDQNGIECIVDDDAGDILYYEPKLGKYGNDKLLQNSDESIFDLVKDKEHLANVLMDAQGDKFKEFAVQWNGLQKKGEDEGVFKTQHCNPIRGNFAEKARNTRPTTAKDREEFEKFRKRWKSLGKKKDSDEDEDYVDDFGLRVNGIEAQVSEGIKMDSAVVYFKDGSKEPMTLANVHDLEGAFDAIRYRLSHEPGDIADIDHIKIGGEVYGRDDIDDYLGYEHELDELDRTYSENIGNRNDRSASEGEVEIMWDTDAYEDFGIFRGDGSTYVIDYDQVETHNDLLNEVCKLIGKEYPDLDFEPEDFVIANEAEFWRLRSGN